MTDNSADTRHTDEFLQQAYALDGLADALTFYDRWAQEYDERMETTLGYVAPRALAEKFADLVGDRDINVLDVGCGTGLTSSHLAAHGFSAFDGIDVTPRMLEISRQRGIYGNLIEADITKPLEIADGAYDAIISSGTFTLGHVGSEPIPELVRVLRPGGWFACTVHKDIWEGRGFAAAFNHLVDSGQLVAVQREAGEFFAGYGATAWYCVYRKPD
jgi:predicted TPR repeat methyltransferase